MSKDNSGPAFPVPMAQIKDMRTPNGVWTEEGSHGMSLRDYFAAAAMQGMLAGTPWLGKHKVDGDSLVRSAYECADAMLLQRAK